MVQLWLVVAGRQVLGWGAEKLHEREERFLGGLGAEGSGAG